MSEKPSYTFEFDGQWLTEPAYGRAIDIGVIRAKSSAEANYGATISTYPYGPLIHTKLMWRDDVGAVRQPCSWQVTVQMIPGASGSITMSGISPTVEAAERAAKKAWPRFLKRMVKRQKGKKR